MNVSLFRNPGRMWAPVAICTLLVGLQALGEDGRAWLRLERDGLGEGQLWRLLSGHLVHLGWRHLALNLAGLVLMWALFAREYGWGRWLVILATSAAAVDAGLYWRVPDLRWYVGLSGVLHGVLAAGALAYCRRGEAAGWVVLVFLAAKLIWEQWAGALPASEAAAGGAVIVDAHLFGALGAVVGVLIGWMAGWMAGRRA
jgi:rhomboid family GlyGly-CTERM serine protease